MNLYSAVSGGSGYGVDGGGFGIRVELGTRFFPLHVVQIIFLAHPASYPIGTGGSFSGDKEAGA
jgi:hypothetical protein